MTRPTWPNRTTIEKLQARFYTDEGISKQNRDAVKDFLTKQKSLKDIGEQRVRKILSVFRVLLTEVSPGFDLAAATEKDLLELHEAIQRTDKKPNTRADYVKIIRRFYKVRDGRGVRAPEKLDFFQNVKHPQITKGPEDLITRDEYKALLNAVINSRDRAIIALLYSCGLRCGEVINLAIKDVVFKDDGIELTVRTLEGNKTGQRPIWVSECYHDLKSWADAHPLKADPEAPFFCTLERHGRRHTHTRIDGYSIRTMLQKKAAKAGVKKRIHPHLFRHTCATNLAVLGFEQAQLCAYMGWRIGSPTAAAYVHMSGQGVKTAYKRALGIPLEEEKARKNCPKCGYENSYLAEECGRCRTSLDPKTRLLQEDKKSRELRFINAVFEVAPPRLHTEFLSIAKEKYEKIEELMTAARQK